MNFEVKKVDTIGAPKTKDAANYVQMLNITVGVSGCTYTDIVATKLVEYTFPNTTPIKDVQTGVSAFAASWVAANYPAIA